VGQTERLFEAIEAGDLTEVQRLLTDDPALVRSRNARGTSALMLALYHRQASAVDVLLSCEIELDLFEAAAVGDSTRVRELLVARPNGAGEYSPDGFSALHLACFFDQQEVVALLLDHGADPNASAQNPTCVRPLHCAVAARCPEVVRLLLAAGADVNAPQQGGWTALHAAARHGDVEIARQLLARGADRLLAAEGGEDAATLAREADQREMIALLRETETRSAGRVV
jgi:ankyrin repeat protein